ncbi:hypothetical protein N7541_005830 [Penicillium brevicompactum]|uniref:Uncharacterized protein n=1 Tax=Penicillium brevicompactum TaxID=5074 RepID=A0A9W9R733_PENBR|nr:hypothetical protein N7541_005830 [Penicillium brevicompactum]
MAEECFNQFRTNHLQYLPFVYIPRDMTSGQLRDRSPFFWICIMDVLTPQNTEKGDSFKRITNHIHQRVMIDPGASMDLLLGMITFIAWGIYSKKPFLNSYVHILMGVVAELGINQSALGGVSIMQDFKFAIGMKRNESGIRTLEERRAVLGCFLISSSAAFSMSKIDAMRWTPLMEESLSVLTDAKESPEDEVLVILVKIYLVLDRMHQLRRDGEPISSPAFYMSALKMQLDAVKQQIPSHLIQNRAIRMYLHSAEFTINEMALGPSAILHLPDLQRLECLFTSLQATKSWLDIWLDLAAVEYMKVPSIIFFQWARAILNLYRLTILEDPTWSKSVVRDTVNILEHLNKAIMAIKCYPEFLKFDQGKEVNVLEKGLRMMEALKCNWEPKLTDLWGLPANDNSDSMVQSDDILPPGMTLPQIDDSWMMEFLGSL